MTSTVGITTTTPLATSPVSSTTGTTSSTDMQDRFLKLLVAQINNQDPLSPMDNAQMTSQMAQINTVSGIQQVNETLTNMAAQFSAMQVLQGSALVGHDVLTSGNTLVSDSTTGMAGGAIDLAGPADAVKVDVLSPTGQVLDSFNLGSLPAGRQAFQWNAASYQGSGHPTFQVTAIKGTASVSATPLMRDTVTSIGSANGAMTIQLSGGKSVGYADLVSIL